MQALYTACAAHSLERGGTLVALGGGVAGDMAGFVAATYMRGVAGSTFRRPFWRWPTPVWRESGSGSCRRGKNLVGAFHPPSLIVADFDLLSTLARNRSALRPGRKS